MIHLYLVGEEAEALAKQGVPFEIVPGISAGIAAPAYAGIPVTHRDASASFAVVTGHRKEGAEEEVKWENLAKGERPWQYIWELVICPTYARTTYEAWKKIKVHLLLLLNGERRLCSVQLSGR